MPAGWVSSGERLPLQPGAPRHRHRKRQLEFRNRRFGSLCRLPCLGARRVGRRRTQSEALLIHRVPPQYAEQARDAGIEGQVVQGLDPGLDANPVVVEATITVNFTLQ